MTATDIRSLYPEELLELTAGYGEKPYRAKQLFARLHRLTAASYDEMTDLSKAFRERLKEDHPLITLKKARMQESALDGTRKYLFALPDGNMIESVLMRYEFGNSVCVSSQVGCRMGCRFCASTVDGLIRDLTASEMLEQIYAIRRDTGEPVSHVVIMGSGEPLDNFTNVVRFIALLTHPDGLNLSRRNITLSTCGIPDRIRELADLDLGVTLALSLHAPDDETRKKLLPIANRYALKEVLSACDYYFEKTGRRVTYEYALTAGVNDSDGHAEALSRLLSHRNAHVNLIPVNPVRERETRRPDGGRVRAFHKILEKNRINATIRREMGSDIDGACGQLRRRFLSEND